MRITQLALILTYLISVGQCQMEPYIVEGHDADISDFPYVAHMSIKCKQRDGRQYQYVCGASIVNQQLILTAAHCTNECTGKSSFAISVGHENKHYGASSTVYSFLQHKKFNEQNLQNDICLVRLKTQLVFSSTVQRVALMRNPPDEGLAVVAGWGIYNSAGTQYPDTLQYGKQYVKNKNYCQKHGGQRGTICATHMDGYIARGDSGNALVVRDYIQIGIVSYTHKSMSVSGRLDFYTDTAYFYGWIVDKSQRICA